MTGLNRPTEQIIGLVFLAGMVLLLVFAITEWEGSTSFILLVVSGVFLLVALYFLTGTQAARGHGGDAGGSQQQSVVIGAPGEPVRTIQQGGVLVVCPNCQARIPEGSRHCSQCGAEL